MDDVLIIGGGLAGCEAAWQLAKRGVRVELGDIKPDKLTPAHKYPFLSELVCSNSLRSTELTTGAGLLKAEMKLLDSLVIRAAETCRVPAGSSLAVDRVCFGETVQRMLEDTGLVSIACREATEVPKRRPAVIATGPLTTSPLAEAIRELTGAEHLYYYDATSPIVSAESIDRERVFLASRYDKGTPDFINCPMTEEEYLRLVDALIAAPKVELREFEEPRFFEGCLPLEEMAARGPLTLAHGPLKPVGLIDPRSGKRPFAVVQLRKEDAEGQAYELVGFQTRLRWSAQKEVFTLIPGLGDAEFLRFGAIHRNTYICSPVFLDKSQRFKGEDDLFFAGQITGVEGYIESAASGLLAGIAAAHAVSGLDYVAPPSTSAHGALVKHVTESDPKRFQPSNIHFGLVAPPEDMKMRGRAKKEYLARRALDDIERWLDSLGD